MATQDTVSRPMTKETAQQKTTSTPTNEDQPPMVEKQDASTPSGPDSGGPPEPEYPTGSSRLLIMLSLYLAVFLVALDRMIIATAIPAITDHFHSIKDVGWYGSAYMLTGASFQLMYGRIYTFYSPKWVFLAAIGIFELGSLICGVTPNSTALIVGRAIAGLGSCGIFSGSMIIMFHCIPLAKRPMWTGFNGMVFGIASVAGPLLGGVLTSKATWRWCFYINLPIGAVAALVIFFILKLPSNPAQPKTWKERISKLDPLGTLLLVPAVVCLLLALQWGGTIYTWNDGRTIALLVLFGVLVLAFVLVQIWKKESATVPPRVFMMRTVAVGSWWSFFLDGSMTTLLYFLPIWFQAIKDVNAVKSGIMSLPFIGGLIIASVVSGILVTKIGYYTPFMIASSCITSVGAGLITTFTTTTAHPRWIGYQFLYGIGNGLGMQQASVGIQCSLDRKDIGTGVSLIFFVRQLGGSIFISVGQNIFANHLASGVTRVSNIDPSLILNTGATDLRKVISAADLEKVLEAYNSALVNAYKVSVVCACLTVVAAVASPWISVKKIAKSGAGAGAGSAPSKV